MIPLKLRLKNFLSYSSTLLDLEGIRLACICGRNGAGKSALIDAITWALWGRSRSGVHHSMLINSGKREMEVELEFISDGQRYRVIRKYAQISPRQARHLLELQIADGQGFKSLSGNTLKETEERLIKEILHMDYQTFINSALLLQGRANEFSIKDPAERKQVLGKILGLELYDHLAEKAREHLKQSRLLRERLFDKISDLKLEIEKMPQHQEELRKLKEERSRLEQELSRQESVLSELRSLYQQLKLKEHQLKEVESSLISIDREIEYWLKEKEERERELEENKRLLERSSEIEEGYRLFLEMRGREEELSGKQHRWHQLEERRRKLEDIIRGERERIESERAILIFKAEEIKRGLAELSSKEEELRKVEEEIGRLEREKESLLTEKEWIDQLSAQVQYLEGEERLIRREQEEIKSKILLLQKGVVSCPLCGTELGPDGVEKLRRQYKVRERELSHRLEAIEREKGRLVQEYQAHKQQMERREEEIGRLFLKKQGERESLKRGIEEARGKEKELAEIEGRVREIEEVLERRGFATQVWRELYEVNKEIDELGYDLDYHEKVRLSLSELKKWEDEKKHLEVAKRLLPSIEDALRKAKDQLEEKKRKKREVEIRREGLIKEIEGLRGVEERLVKAEEVYQDLRGRQIENQRLLAMVEERIRRCEELKEERKRREEELEKVVEEEGIYKDLAEAFGKEGVQALLIEQSLPFLEEEANKLVKKLTDNRLGLRFETQKSTRGGETIETLEIEISDELGTRNYEMYSGGEAFRIDFAIRVALARLVAHRAGASLPLIIIDEGIGSQDTEGRERLVEAIKAIADEFEMILLITHIEELKELFPVRIEVTKTEQGSIAQVIA